jgi:hypothetical protein
VCPRGDRDIRGKTKDLAPEIEESPSRLAQFFDLLCAGALFLLAIAGSMLIPKSYTGRVWMYGTDLALLFAAMLNLLRIQNASMRGVKIFSITANFALSALFISLMVSIGLSRTISNAQVPGVTALLLVETAFSVRRSR